MNSLQLKKNIDLVLELLKIESELTAKQVQFLTTLYTRSNQFEIILTILINFQRILDYKYISYSPNDGSEHHVRSIGKSIHDFDGIVRKMSALSKLISDFYQERILAEN